MSGGRICLVDSCTGGASPFIVDGVICLINFCTGGAWPFRVDGGIRLVVHGRSKLME